MNLRKIIVIAVAILSSMGCSSSNDTDQLELAEARQKNAKLTNDNHRLRELLAIQTARVNALESLNQSMVDLQEIDSDYVNGLKDNLRSCKRQRRAITLVRN